MDQREQDLDRWLAKQLGGTAFTRESASDDASFRRYFRIRYGGGTRIVMDAPPGLEDCRPFIDVAERLAAADVHVPTIHARDLERGFLLLDDLGGTAYLDSLAADTADALYCDALDTLVRMQRRGSVRGLPAYDEALLRTELELFPEWFLGCHLGRRSCERTRRVLERSFALLIERCMEQPTCFVHRDYHSRNLMVTAGRNPGVLDFQDAVAGPLTYDLVSLLRDVYVAWPTADVARWLGEYQQRARDAGVVDSADPESIVRWFDLTGVQRHLKVAGIFCRLYYRDGKPRYLRDLPLTLSYLLNVSAHYPELAPLADLLSELDVMDASARASRAQLEAATP